MVSVMVLLRETKRGWECVGFHIKMTTKKRGLTRENATEMGLLQLEAQEVGVAPKELRFLGCHTRTEPREKEMSLGDLFCIQMTTKQGVLLTTFRSKGFHVQGNQVLGNSTMGIWL